MAGYCFLMLGALKFPQNERDILWRVLSLWMKRDFRLDTSRRFGC